MNQNYTAVIRRTDAWWVGRVLEIDGVFSQGKTKRELLDNLQSALEEAIELNREAAMKDMLDDYEEVSIAV